MWARRFGEDAWTNQEALVIATEGSSTAMLSTSTTPTTSP
jgi:hypothetical protein